MGETVEFPSNGHTCMGYLATPSSGRGPGVVVIQEYWGLVPHIRDVCDRFAAEGFVALAPDLYHGKEAKEPDEAGKLLMALDLPEAARDMLGAGRWLAESDRTAGDRVGIVGFCMGGALALYAASLSDVFAAVVPFYPYMGVTAAAKPDVTKIKGAVLGHFAEKDHAYTKEQGDALEQQRRGAGVAAAPPDPPPPNQGDDRATGPHLKCKKQADIQSPRAITIKTGKPATTGTC